MSQGDKIVALHGALPPEAQDIDPNVLRLAEKILAEVKRGEVVALAVVTVDGAGFPYTRSTYNGHRGVFFTMMAGASLLLRRIHDHTMTEATPHPEPDGA